jgi:hypothetical protein
MIESCATCGAIVPYSDAVHVTTHTKSDAGVVDAFVCRECYEGSWPTSWSGGPQTEAQC